MSDSTRKIRTPAERAVEALAVEQRRVEKLHAKREALKAEIAALAPEYDAAVARRDHLAQSPDLPPTDDEPAREQAIEAAEDRADQVAFDAARERA